MISYKIEAEPLIIFLIIAPKTTNLTLGVKKALTRLSFEETPPYLVKLKYSQDLQMAKVSALQLKPQKSYSHLKNVRLT